MVNVERNGMDEICDYYFRNFDEFGLCGNVGFSFGDIGEATEEVTC